MGGSGQPRGEPGVAVVIPTVGRATLAETVAVVLSDDAVAEVVVVADRAAGQVKTVLADRSSDARVQVIEGPGRGASWARQRGVEVSTAPILLFLDDDVFPSAGLAAAHARRHREPDRVVMGFMPVADASRRVSAVARVYGDDYLAACAHLDADPSRVLPDLWAGNVSLTRVSAERVPLASADCDYWYREDQAFGLRCARAGLCGAFDRSLRAEHRFERSLPAFLAAARDQAMELEAMRRQFPELADDDAGATAPRGLPRRLVQAAEHRPFDVVLRGAVRAGIHASGLLRAGRFEQQGVALLRTLVQQQARDEQRRAAG